MTDVSVPITSKKDWSSVQEVRWCPGCGDYSILTAVQMLMPDLGVRREDMVFLSGIGCAARFPYYMNTYGMHSIHGRAPAIATGLAVSRQDLSVCVVTGDGDALSLGGNHLIHPLRRNPTTFQKTLAVNDYYLCGPDWPYPMGNIQMLGKSDDWEVKGEAPKLLGWAPSLAYEIVAERSLDFWLAGEDLPQPDNRVTLRSDGPVKLAVAPDNNTEGVVRLRG